MYKPLPLTVVATAASAVGLVLAALHPASMAIAAVLGLAAAVLAWRCYARVQRELGALAERLERYNFLELHTEDVVMRVDAQGIVRYT
jgi:membrane protein implicated in regulation of membrane protease activity